MHSSHIATPAFAALLASTVQLEVGPQLTTLAIAICNIIVAAMTARYVRQAKHVARQRQLKRKPPYMVSTGRKRPPHKASVAFAPNGLGSKRRTTSTKPNA